MKKILILCLLALASFSANAQNIIRACYETDWGGYVYIRFVTNTPAPGSTVWIDGGSGPVPCTFRTAQIDADGVNWDYLYQPSGSIHIPVPDGPAPCYTVYINTSGGGIANAQQIQVCMCPKKPTSSCFTKNPDGSFTVKMIFDDLYHYANSFPPNVYNSLGHTIVFGYTVGWVADPTPGYWDYTFTLPASYGTPNPCLEIPVGNWMPPVAMAHDYGNPLNWVTTSYVTVCPCCSATDFSVVTSESSTTPGSYVGTFSSGMFANWTFGDGTTGTGANVSHTYALPGSYYVCAKSKNADGTNCEKCKWICIAPQHPMGWDGFCGGMRICNADFTIDINGNDITILNYYSLLYGTFDYSFGDGGTASSPAGFMTHHYTSPGTYTICVTCTLKDEFGNILCTCQRCIDICIADQSVWCCYPAEKMNRNSGGSANVTPLSDDLVITPNPANNSATLVFDLEKQADVKIMIIDQVGRTVTAFNRQSLEPGRQNIEINTSKLATGIYMINVQTDKGIITKRLSVIK